MLNAELFSRDADHSAYFGAANDLMMAASRRNIQTVARQMAINHLQDVMQQSGLGSRFDTWASDLDESFATAYLIASAEEWDVNGDELNELIEQSLRELNETRTMVGADTIDATDLNSRLSMVLFAFAHEGDEFEPLIDHVESQDAWERLEFLRPTYEMIGAHLANVSEREKEPWQAFNQFAWRDGVLLAVLAEAGVFGAPQVAQQGLHAGDRPLSTALYERDAQAYRLKAGELMSMTAHRVPDVIRELYWQLIAPFLKNRKLGERYGQFLQDTFEAGYMLTVSETWAELDPEQVRAQIDAGLRQVIAERDSRPVELLLPDAEYRIRNVSYGVIGGLPFFASLKALLERQPAYERIAEMRLIAIASTLQYGPIKGRHAGKMKDAPPFVGSRSACRAARPTRRSANGDADAPVAVERRFGSSKHRRSFAPLAGRGLETCRARR